MSHSAAIPLEWGRESIGYFSKQLPRRLLVFVHGFNGSAYGTWEGTDSVLIPDPRTETTDIVFFGYRSLRVQPELSAGMLRTLLNEAGRFQPKWRIAATKALGRTGRRDYDEILIVAHSLGAPVARRAVVDAIRVKASWADKVKLVLFAPAHMGAYLAKLRNELPGGIGALVGSIVSLAKLGVLSLDALKPGSPFLSQLLQDSIDEYANGWRDPICAQQVIFGALDNVVMTQRFLHDQPADVWDNHGHCSICRCKDTAPTVMSHL